MQCNYMYAMLHVMDAERQHATAVQTYSIATDVQSVLTVLSIHRVHICVLWNSIVNY